MDLIRQLEAEQAAKIEAKRKLPEFQPGDTVRVQVRVTEGSRTRVQAYEGVVIARSGSGFQENFTVRKISYGEGVERVFPVYSPMVEGVEIVRRGKVRRAKLYYLRDRRGKSARISENTGVRARKLNDEERDALNAEKARIEAEKVAAAEIMHGDHLADGSTCLVPDLQPDQVGVVELVLLAVVGQHRAVDEQLGAGKRLGGVAVADTLEAHHHDGIGGPDVYDLEGAAILGVERPVVGQRQRIAGEGLHP